MKIVSIETVGKSESLAFGPGKVFMDLIHLITGVTPGPKCKCLTRARQMNEWGWMGCLAHQQEIVGWLVIEARNRGHSIGEHEVQSLFVAAFREAVQRVKKEKNNDR